VQQAVEYIEEFAHGNDVGNLCEELREAKTNFVRLSPRVLQILGEPSSEPSRRTPRQDSLPERINYDDVHTWKFLEQGACGSVLECKWQGKDMVVKIVNLDPEEPKVRERFEMEVSILSSLAHPNAVQTFGFGYTRNKEKGFIMMEQMEADLSKIICERRGGGESPVFPVDVCINIMLQIMEAMCSLREKRVIHRDLKPANILVNRPDKDKEPYERFYQVKLANFGTSKFNDINSRFGTLKASTPAYMAPEANSAINDESGHQTCPCYSWEADVYSFGIVCSKIISGNRPFQHLGVVNCRSVLAAVRQRDMPKVPLHCEHPLTRLIEDCWKLEPNLRPDIWEVRERLWECRVRHFFEMKRPPTSWEPFCTNLS
jgi:serine/threonine protein kinase